MENIESHLGLIINREMKNNQDSIFQVDFNNGQTESFGEFRLRTLRLAQYLSEKDFGVGDVIALCCDNHNDGTVPLMSSVFLGTAIMTLHPLLTKVEFRHLFTLSKPKIVFADLNKAVEIKEVLKEIGNPCDVVVFGKDNEVPEDCIPFSLIVKPTGNEENFVIPDFDPKNTTVFALCSSGTTGLPKIVCLTHYNVLVQIKPLKMKHEDLKKKKIEKLTCMHSYSNRLRMSSNSDISSSSVDDPKAITLWSSLYWLTGAVTVLISAITGAKLVHGVCEFSAKIFYQVVDKYKPIMALISPAAVQTLVNDADFSKHIFPSFQSLMTIGSSINPEFLKRFQAKVPNGHVVLCYGLTESSGGICFAPVAKRKDNCVGSPNYNFEWKVVDADEKTLGPNEIGELRIKGPSIFKEYLGNPEATASAFDSDGFMQTGDLVYFDEDKDIFIVGRSKEMIKYRNFQRCMSVVEPRLQILWSFILSGLNLEDIMMQGTPVGFMDDKIALKDSVTPAELELLLRQHGAVYDAAVVGVDSSLHGQVPMAFIELKADSSATAKELIAHIDEQVADFKKLRGGIVFVEKLPMTPNGKSDRKTVNNMKLTAKPIFE